jgi:hypothetical protein
VYHSPARVWSDDGAVLTGTRTRHTDISVREMLLRDAASERYLQRKHVRVASTGFALAAVARGECSPEGKPKPASVYEKMREGREEGGEPPEAA